ncbi:MAG: carbohydrate ABC transporter permease [Phycicoccus sp.]
MASLTVLFLVPLVVLVLGSLQRPLQPPPDGLDLWPDPPDITSYRSLTAFLPLGRPVLNSVVLVGVAVPLTVVVTSMAGLAVVMASRRARRLLLALAMVTLLVPVTALWVPRAVVLRELGLADTGLTVSLLALAGTSPFYVLLFALVYARIPAGVLEAAALEGLGPLRTWWQVALPLARPAVVAVGALSFVYYWSTFMDPLTLVSSPEKWPLALGLRGLGELETALYPIYLAGAVVATLPALLVFAVAQRSYFAAVEVRG